MSPRHTSRRTRRRQQIEENLVDKLRLAEFKAEFPNEVAQICNLAPLQAKPDLLDDFLLKVVNIVGLGRRRLDKDHVERIIKSIRSSKDAADKIPAIAEALGEMDAGELGNVLSIATEVFPRPFFKNQDPMGIFRLLRDFHNLLLTLHAAIQLGTGIDERPPGRGRPSSPYVQPTLKLIEAWEVITAEQSWNDLPLLRVKDVPTPKRLDVRDQKIVTKQPSTEFIRIALRMIDPNIKDAQVFTAIKNALSLRGEINEFIKTRPPKTIIGKLNAVERFQTRRVPVRKKASQAII
jgi:hypothetical protein